ncbi:hypothetical protein BDP67DRAFT_286291 [Colletotrichum lupini]|nr:hypothetical protein BDP67DRAFT_286291 [Colletotrichum lupini]
MKLQGQGHDAPAVVRNRDPSNVVDREGQIKSGRKRPYSKGAHPPAHPPWPKSFAAESGPPKRHHFAFHTLSAVQPLGLDRISIQRTFMASPLHCLAYLLLSEFPSIRLSELTSPGAQAKQRPLHQPGLARQSFPSSRNEVISCSSTTVTKYCIV